MVTASNAAIVSVSGVMQNRNNAVEGSGMPIGGEFGSSKYLDEWKASGLNPDDEPGDVDEEGSGNDPEMVDGSGHPPSSNKHRNDGSTTTNDESIRVNEALLNANIRQLQPSSTEASPSTTSRVIIHRPEIEVPSLAAPGPTRPPIQFHVVSSSPASFISTKLSTTTSSFAVATVKPTVRPPIPPQLPPYVTEDESYELLKPGILAAISGGGVVGVLVVILVVMFIVYRLRKKDEGSYSLDEPHQPPNYSYAYQKAATKEFYA